jgi:hypothetical protein
VYPTRIESSEKGGRLSQRDKLMFESYLEEVATLSDDSASNKISSTTEGIYGELKEKDLYSYYQ